MANTRPRSAASILTMPATPNLPWELVEDILVRLPPESLVRFKCICKSWFALFENLNFISHHLSISNQNHSSNDNILLFAQVSSTIINETKHSVSKLLLMSSDDHAFFSGKEIFTPNIFHDTFCNMRISGHCNGIICLRGDILKTRVHNVALYNPATRELQFLPPSFRFYEEVAIGFGCDPKSDDLKVVRIWSPTVSYCRNATTNVIVEEYALSTDSWRVLDNTNLRDFLFYGYDFGMHFKGTLYWWANDDKHDCWVLLALNVGDEVFHKLPMPRRFDLGEYFSRLMGVLNESISLATFTYIEGYMAIEIWVMDGFGVNVNGCTWTKLWCIRGLPELIPLAFWKGNQLLVEETRTQVSNLQSKGKRKLSCRITSYDINTFKNVDVEVEGHPDIIAFEATNYVKSLVSIKGRTGR